MPQSVPCPYCNARVPVPNPPPADGRVVCPRCEELVAVGGATNGSQLPPSAAASPTRPRPTNRAVAGLVVAVMLGMAALGLAFALQTVGVRRANDTKGAQPPEQVPESRPLPPAEWPGLGYLPDDVQAVAGVRVADALVNPAGRALLSGLNLGPDTAILGAPFKNFDHLVVGVNWRTLPPRIVMVAHGTFDRTKASDRTLSQHGKTLERTKLWVNGPDGVVWRPEPNTLVAALLPEDFGHIPEKPRTTVPLPEMVADRLDAKASAWLAGTVDANAAGLAAGIGLLPQGDREVWNELEALAVSFCANGARLDVNMQVRGRDAEAADTIARTVAESLSKVGLTPGRLQEFDRGEHWQRVTVTADAKKIAEWLKDLRK